MPFCLHLPHYFRVKTTIQIFYNKSNFSSVQLFFGGRFSGVQILFFGGVQFFFFGCPIFWGVQGGGVHFFICFVLFLQISNFFFFRVSNFVFCFSGVQFCFFFSGVQFSFFCFLPGVQFFFFFQVSNFGFSGVLLFFSGLHFFSFYNNRLTNLCCWGSAVSNLTSDFLYATIV